MNNTCGKIGYGWRDLLQQGLQIRNVEGELGGHSRPTNIVADRVINQLIEIGEAEACDVREQGCGRGSSSGGSASSSFDIRAGSTASVMPWTRHSEGDRGRTRRKRRTR